MERSFELEMMDGRDNPPALLEGDLANLRRLNRYLGGARALCRALAPIVTGAGKTRLKLLDVGAGSGDLAAHIVSWCARRGVIAEVVTVERDPVSAALAARRNRAVRAITGVRGDAMALPFAPGAFDCVIASQLLQHITEVQIVELLRAWAKLSRRAIIVGDLVRHPLAYHGIRVLTRLCTRNEMTLTDAPLSVRRAFTIPEWRELLARAAVGAVTIEPLLPFRLGARIEVGK
jgi:SAM-dependent methyltransferase